MIRFSKTGDKEKGRGCERTKKRGPILKKKKKNESREKLQTAGISEKLQRRKNGKLKT